MAMLFFAGAAAADDERAPERGRMVAQIAVLAVQTGVVLATLLAMHLGFTVVVILAAMFYCVAVAVAPE